MPRTLIAHQDVPGSINPPNAALTWDASDVANGNLFTSTGRELLLARNVDGAAPHTLTLRSATDPFGRDQDEAINVPLDAYILVGPLAQAGWRQADGAVWFDADDAQIEVAVIRLDR